MLRFFRKVRLQLLPEHKSTKYLKYAVGEILLVVLGILIALQINNWNESRQQLSEERKILSRMVLELDLNIQRMQLLDSAHPGGWPIKKTVTFFDSLAIVIANGVDTTEIDFICSGPVFRFNIFNLHSDIFEEMKFGGYLYNLQSEMLAGKIQSYYRLIESETDYNDRTREQRDRVLDSILYGFRRLKADYDRLGFSGLSYHAWIFDNRSEEYYNFEQYVETSSALIKRSRSRMLNIIEASEQLKQSILDSTPN